VINERTYRGDLVPDNVLIGLCSAFNDEPTYCASFKEEQGIAPALSNTGVSRNILILVVVFLVLLNVGILMLYRRC